MSKSLLRQYNLYIFFNIGYNCYYYGINLEVDNLAFYFLKKIKNVHIKKIRNRNRKIQSERQTTS